jgi:hypothetical protein
MMLQIDIENPTSEQPSQGSDAAISNAKEALQLQLVEAESNRGSRGRTGPRLKPHPVVIAGALTEFEDGGDVPSAGKNIPEMGQ